MLAAALQEAMALALHSAGTKAVERRLELTLHAEAPVGTFVHVEAEVQGPRRGELHVSAAAYEAARADSERRVLADARGIFVEEDGSASF